MSVVSQKLRHHIQINESTLVKLLQIEEKKVRLGIESADDIRILHTPARHEEQIENHILSHPKNQELKRS